jgi:hypothetical protein
MPFLTNDPLPQGLQPNVTPTNLLQHRPPASR